MRKRSLTLSGHRTSIALEPDFWQALEEIAAARGQSLPELIAAIDSQRETTNLASALRLEVLHHFRAKAEGATAKS